MISTPAMHATSQENPASMVKKVMGSSLQIPRKAFTDREVNEKSPILSHKNQLECLPPKLDPKSPQEDLFFYESFSYKKDLEYDYFDNECTIDVRETLKAKYNNNCPRPVFDYAEDVIPPFPESDWLQAFCNDSKTLVLEFKLEHVDIPPIDL